MPDRPTFRSYIEIENPSDQLIELYRNWTPREAASLLNEIKVAFSHPVEPAHWKSAFPRWLSAREKPSRVVFAFEQSLRDVESNRDLPHDLGDGMTLNASPQIALADAWCPIGGGDTTFGTRANALALINAPYLAASGATGLDVNVVIVDQGLDASRLPTYVDGWDQGPVAAGTTTGGHGMMVARNVLSIAPRASLWDCPLIPEAIEDVSSFIDIAADAIDVVLDEIAVLQAVYHRTNWVLVNSWAVYDRRTEYPAGSYTNDPTHAFNVAMQRADTMGIDVVFAAGNCGEYCPKWRCGINDRGQGESILGANSLACVLTAGAVRPDGVWIGYSSQGPGQPKLETAKPDLCAPSQFADPDDEDPVNSGTSTSAALAAGTIAALRSVPSGAGLTPEQMRTLLRDTAVGGDPQEALQLGSGILDAKGAFENLPP